MYVVLNGSLTTISAPQLQAVSPEKATALDTLKSLPAVQAPSAQAANKQVSKGRGGKRARTADKEQTTADAPQQVGSVPEEINLVTGAPESPEKNVPRRARSGSARPSESEGGPVTNEAESGQPAHGAIAAGMLEYRSQFPPGTGAICSRDMRGQVGHSAQFPSSLYYGPAAPPSSASYATESIHKDLIQLEVGADPTLYSLKAAAVQALRECRGPFDEYRPKTRAAMKLDIAIRSVRIAADERIAKWDDAHSTKEVPQQKQLERVRKIYSLPAICSVNTPFCRS